MAGVTHQQNAAFRFIAEYTRQHSGTPPSYDEIGDALQLRSRSGVSRLVNGLEARGLIRRQRNLARSIEIVQPSGSSGFVLPADLRARLVRHCEASGEIAAAFVIIAVATLLKSREDDREH